MYQLPTAGLGGAPGCRMAVRSICFLLSYLVVKAGAGWSYAAPAAATKARSKTQERARLHAAWAFACSRRASRRSEHPPMQLRLVDGIQMQKAAVRLGSKCGMEQRGEEDPSAESGSRTRYIRCSALCRSSWARAGSVEQDTIGGDTKQTT
jgi:hypothetical protein